jgi:hypothetical protein
MEIPVELMTKIQHGGLPWLTCALAAMGVVPGQAQTATETVLHSFASPPKGANPFAGVIRDSAIEAIENVHLTELMIGNNKNPHLSVWRKRRPELQPQRVPRLFAREVLCKNRILKHREPDGEKFLAKLSAFTAMVPGVYREVEHRKDPHDAIGRKCHSQASAAFRQRAYNPTWKCSRCQLT